MLMAFSACNDDTLTVGDVLTNEVDVLKVSSANYNVTTRTVTVDSVIARTNDCYFGRIKDPETGAYIKSDFMSQMNILETFSLPPIDSIVSQKEGNIYADSCEIIVYLKDASSFCDSLAAMKMRVSELAEPLKEGEDYYSNFDPEKAGMLREDGLKKNKMFTWSDLTVSASKRAETDYFNNISIPVNEPYTDADGQTYNNYGTYILQQYYNHPEWFKNSQTFIRNVCPGFFFEITDGQGFYSKIPYTGVQIHYRTISEDSVYNTVTTLAGTAEVLQTIRVTNEQERLEELAQDETCTYLKSPAGLFTEVTIPVDEIMNGHSNDSLMAVNLAFQRLNNDVHGKSSLTVPQNVLLICKDSVEHFFAEEQLPDNVTSYTATYTSAGKNQYAFNNISSLVSHLWQLKTEGEKTDSYWTTKHPNWNKLLLIPIHLDQVTTTSYYNTQSTTTIGIEHDLSISSTRLVGGGKNPNDPIQLSVVYGRF